MEIKSIGKEMITVSGLVMPHEWDEFGYLVKYKLSAKGEVDYILTDENDSDFFNGYLRKWVKIIGEYSEWENCKTLKVLSIEIDKLYDK